MRQIIMLGGIHGAGKSYLCNEIIDLCDIKVYSASQLMEDYSGKNVDDNKKVKDINMNQNILTSAIDEYLPQNESMIIDGHFCLINQQSEISDITVDTFREIGINAIIVLVEEADIIVERLNLRDSTHYSLDFIDDFQNKEISNAINIAKELNIKILIYKKSDDNKLLLEFINKVNGGK